MSKDVHLRPTLASSVRKDWKGFFLQEWSLLLLAAAMTLTIWLSVREQVVKLHPVSGIRIELEVEPVMRDRLGAVLNRPDDTIDIQLRCSEREKNAAIRAMEQGGRRTVRLKVRVPPEEEDRTLDVDRDRDVFAWPFDHGRILAVGPTAPGGRVFLITPQMAVVEAPATIPSAEELEREHSLRVTIIPSERNVEARVPEGFFDEPLTPDPIVIDPDDYAEAAAGASEEITLTFKNWHARAKSKPWLSAYQTQFKLKEIKAKLTVTPVGSRPIENTLNVLLDPKKYEWGLRPPEARQRVKRRPVQIHRPAARPQEGAR